MLRIFTLLLLSSICFAQQPPAAVVRFVRSLSGPSGKVVGAQFVLDETRSRFVFPQDRTLVVSFEWDAPPGDHTMTGVWKAPDGRVVYISPDLRMQTPTRELRGYWTYELYPTTQSGFWTLEVRVDGAPAGSHNFELVIPAAAAPVQTTAAPTLGDVYRSSVGSLVWIHKLDAEGKRFDSSHGFVIGKDRIATAFQSVDSAVGLEVEFEGGRKVSTNEIWNVNRLQDWAVVKADTLDLPALTYEAPTASFIGERLVVYNVESKMTRAFGGVDITGAGNDPVFGPRIQFSPQLVAYTAGGPLLSLAGKVVGIVGGSQQAGERITQVSSTGVIYVSDSSPRSATPINLITEAPIVPTTLKALDQAHTMTIPMKLTSNFVFGATVLAANRDSTVRPASVTEFSRKDTIGVVTQWTKAEPQGKGTIGGKIYDAQNRMVVDIGAKSTSLNDDKETRFSVSLNLGSSPRGTYRVDMEWNGQPTWRSFFTIID